MPARSLWRKAALAAAVVPLVACQANVRLTVAVSGGGSGDVAVALTVDREAAARVGDVGSALRVGDLQRRGWVLLPVTTAADGSVTATIHHPFRDPADASRVLAQLSGPKGPITLAVSHHGGLVSSTVGAAGAVDLAGGPDAFADDALRQSLGVPSLAALLAALQQQGDTLPALGTTVVLALPGRPAQVVGTGHIDGHRVIWNVPLGARQSIGASSHVIDDGAELWFAGAAATGAALIAITVTGLLLRRGRRGSPGFMHTRRHRDNWSLSRR